MFNSKEDNFRGSECLKHPFGLFDNPYYVPPTEGECLKHIAFGADPVGVHVASCLHSVSWTNAWILTKLAQTHYWGGGGGGVIKFWWPWPNFQGHHTIKTVKMSLVCTSWTSWWILTKLAQKHHWDIGKEMIRVWWHWPHFQISGRKTEFLRENMKLYRQNLKISGRNTGISWRKCWITWRNVPLFLPEKKGRWSRRKIKSGNFSLPAL